MKYSNIIMEHFDHPRNVGVLAGATHIGEAKNEACLDWLKVHLRVEGGVVLEATFQAEGCVPSMAAGSWLTEWACGRELEAVQALTAAQVEAELGGLPSSKKHAAYLITDTLAELSAI